MKQQSYIRNGGSGGLDVVAEDGEDVFAHGMEGHSQFTAQTARNTDFVNLVWYTGNDAMSSRDLLFLLNCKT